MYFSFQKIPVILICDDSCTYCLHCKHRYPTLYEVAYGTDRKGCFENPDDNKPPSRGLDCPDIVPLEYEERPGLPNHDAMKNPSQLVSESSKNSITQCILQRLQKSF